MVIFNHTNDRGFYRYAMDKYSLGSIVWIANTFMSIACKSGVYIFFMISGALLLGKKESVRKTYGRAVKFVIVTLVFVSIYKGIDCYRAGQVFTFEYFRQNVIAGSYWHLWYLYAHIGLVFTLPFLRDFARGLSFDNWRIMCIISIILCGILPVIEWFQVLNGGLKPWWIVSHIVVYPITGYILDSKIDITSITRNTIIKLWFGNLLAFVISIVSEYFFILKHPGDRSETYLLGFVLINSAVIFITAKYIATKVGIGAMVKKIISKCGELTFGIYLLHILALWQIPQLHKFWTTYFETGRIGAHIGIYGTCIAVFVLCGIVVSVLKKIPIIRYLF